MNSSDEPKHQAKRRGVGARMLGIKNMWRNMFSRKKDKIKDAEDLTPQDHFCLPRESPIAINKENLTMKDVDVDIMELDKDRIRTSCKSSLQDIPQFPSKEEVRKRIEDAHKYYGIKCVYNYYVAVGNSEKNQEPLPSWYYILERPLVEQYVLMNNYIRKLSVLASLKSQTEVGEPDALEDKEEVSSISSQSDYSDFPNDSELIGIYKKSKRERVDTDDDYRRNVTAMDKYCETRQNNKSEVSTVTTKDYDIVIREPKIFFEARNNDTEDSNNTGDVAERNTPGLSKEHRGSAQDDDDDDNDEEESSNDQLDVMRNNALSSGDHLPDMKDFDLSYNLSECTTITPPLPGQSYYHWRGNSCPTKTPLLNTDTRPSRHRGPRSSMDFWSFRNFSLSPEFIEMCDRYAKNPEVQELHMNALEFRDDSQSPLNSNNVVEKNLEQNDDENTGNFDECVNIHPTMSRNNEDEQLELFSVSQINLNDDSDRGETASCSPTSSMASVDTKIPANAERKN